MITRGSVDARALLTSVAAGLVLVVVFAAADAGVASVDRLAAANASAARLGPAPVPCHPAPCGQPGQPALPSGQLQQSSIIHLAITPHVARPGDVVTMVITYSGSGHCRVEDGSTCGPQGTPEISMVRVDCRTHAEIPVPTFAQADATTQCFKATPSTAVGAPFYGIIIAPVGNCGSTNGVSDCISADYLLIEPPCRGQAADIASAGSSADCPLKVSVSGRLHMTSGLTHRPFRNPDVARFFSESTGTSNDVCQSGCTDLVVTVRDPSNHNRPVAGAAVQASVQPIAGGLAPYPSGERPGAGYLCLGGGVVANAERCGNGFREITDHTDGKGQVKLRYWAPGVLREEKVLLTVMAQKGCSKTACPTRQKSGVAQPNPTLTVDPHVLIGTFRQARTGELNPEQARDLAAWTTNTGFTRFKEFLLHQGVEKLLSTALTTMLEAEAELPVAAAAIIKEYNALNLEEQGFMAMVLNSFKVRERGLGVASADTFHKPGPTPGRDFLLEFAADNGPFTIDPGGLTWRYGQALAKVSQIPAQSMQLRVFEVSYCRQGEVCGPGYSGAFPHRHDGIRPFLYFEFTAPLEGAFGTLPPFTDSFIVPYSAEAWMQSQFGG
jgi:hypothetical protein